MKDLPEVVYRFSCKVHNEDEPDEWYTKFIVLNEAEVKWLLDILKKRPDNQFAFEVFMKAFTAPDNEVVDITIEKGHVYHGAAVAPESKNEH